MFDRFTDRARRAMGAARQGCQVLRHHEIRTGHLLLALLEDRENGLAGPLAGLGLTLERVHDPVAAVDPPGAVAPSRNQLPFDGPAMLALELTLAAASTAAVERGRFWIEPADLLLGVIAVPDGPAASALAALGVSAERVAEAIGRRLPDRAATRPLLQPDLSAPCPDERWFHESERRWLRDRARSVCAGATVLGVLGLLIAIPESMRAIGWTADLAYTTGARVRTVAWEVAFLLTCIVLGVAGLALNLARGPQAARRARRAHAVAVVAGLAGIAAGSVGWSNRLAAGSTANALSWGIAMTVIAVAANGLVLAIPTLRDPVDPPPPGA